MCILVKGELLLSGMGNLELRRRYTNCIVAIIGYSIYIEFQCRIHLYFEYDLDISVSLTLSRLCEHHNAAINGDSIKITLSDHLVSLETNIESSLRKIYCRHHDLVSRYGTSASQMTTDISTCRKHFSVHSSFMICHRICN
jgi:hypothetical protein